jgi:hypothetical protein
MREIVSILMAGSLLLHAALGCCRHHAHACQGCDGTAAQARQIGNCCQHHPEECTREHPSQTPCKCKVECQGVCSYVAPQKVQLDFPKGVAPFAAIVVDPVLADANLARGGSFDVAHFAEFEPPLRLHLLNQVMLI